KARPTQPPPRLQIRRIHPPSLDAQHNLRLHPNRGPNLETRPRRQRRRRLPPAQPHRH
ncbi:hypothetical protein LTR12_018597, partial [Friedmanniomyces endolithicus]